MNDETFVKFLDRIDTIKKSMENIEMELFNLEQMVREDNEIHS